MFIHIGNDSVIRSRDIILILDYDVITSSSIMNEMIKAKTKENKVTKIMKAKSIIVTSDLIYYSSLSVSTLKKRSSIVNMISKFENYSIEK